MHSLIFGSRTFFQRVRHEPVSTFLLGTAAAVDAAATATATEAAIAGGSLAAGALPLAPVMTPATAGLIGTGGQFAAGQALTTLSTVGSLFSGISGRVQAANTAQAQSDMYEREAKLAEHRQIQRDQALIAKQHANAAASGLVASSGSPLATTMASTDDLRTNTAAAGYSGRVQAASRRMEANNSLLQIPGIVGDALTPRPGSVLGFLMDRRRF
jgi:hypothetical protein